MNDLGNYMFVSEAASELRRSTATIRRYLRLGLLDGTRLGALPGDKGGGKYNITRESVERLKNGGGH